MRASVIFSGIQPSGSIHLGNYLGAIRQWLAPAASLPPGHACACSLFSVVDLHALTVPGRGGAALRRSTLEVSASLLACGLAPSPTLRLFPQSAVREHTELAWLLACQTPLGKLQRMTQYKQKGRGQEGSSNLGLLAYPVLQAADILLYRATHVPVGEDQQQHLELAREVAEAANAAWGAGVQQAQQQQGVGGSGDVGVGAVVGVGAGGVSVGVAGGVGGGGGSVGAEDGLRVSTHNALPLPAGFFQQQAAQSAQAAQQQAQQLAQQQQQQGDGGRRLAFFSSLRGGSGE
jgi:tryptophanyl-tRNA synthetase